MMLLLGNGHGSVIRTRFQVSDSVLIPDTVPHFYKGMSLIMCANSTHMIRPLIQNLKTSSFDAFLLFFFIIVVLTAYISTTDTSSYT